MAQFVTMTQARNILNYYINQDNQKRKQTQYVTMEVSRNCGACMCVDESSMMYHAKHRLTNSKQKGWSASSELHGERESVGLALQPLI